MVTQPDPQWPALPLQPWQDTYATLHLWTQIVGKIRMACMPWINHSWHTALYVTPCGLTTSLMPYGERGFDITLDFVRHELRITTTGGERRGFALEPMSVADFYKRIFAALSELGISVRIWPMPVELPDPIESLAENTTQAAYDADAVVRFWQALVQIERVFTRFRARFVGKVSPVHFFWGAFDLAVTRFSGRPAPVHPGGAPNCADWVMVEAYSHEVSSAGFWPGMGFGEAAFYSYAYPEPEGYSSYAVKPDAATYLQELGEFVLPYEAVRTAVDPDATLLEFLQTTYDAAAERADWNRDALEQKSEPGGRSR